MNFFVNSLLPWYTENARDLPWRKTRDPYCIWISEIMAQQTRIEVVIDYYLRFIAVLPDIRSLAEVDEEQLLKLWEGLGYYSRARNLQKAAKVIMEKYDGHFPATFEEIKALPGIGVYTAGAICSIAYGLPVAAVDGNVCRVLARYLNDGRLVNDALKQEYKEKLEAVYPEDAGGFTQAIMELGALVCTPKKLQCDVCPLKNRCLGYKEGTFDQLPNLKQIKQRKIVDLTVLLVECEGKWAICKREDGLLKDLYQYPNLEGHKSEKEILQKYETLGPVDIKQVSPQRHIFSHVEWNMSCYVLKTTKKNPEWIYADEKECQKSYPMANAFSRFNCEKNL